MFAKVRTVESVSAVFLKSNPPTFLVQAAGTVPTGGWSDGQLAPRVYITPPDDGLWDFDFIAKAPRGITTAVISPIGASFSLFDPPTWVKGARVHASLNSADSASDAAAPTLVAIGEPIGSQAKALSGGVDGFPWLIAP